MRLSLSLLFLSSIFFVSFCDAVTINSVDDFITFSNNVNGGTGFSGSTVLLDSDIDFTGHSEQFTPIGGVNYFLGTFDGQGHVISNLTVSTSSSLYTGLFGYSHGTTIRNVVIDDTCSFANSFSSSSGEEEPCVGSIIGYCESIYGACTIENIVNMANVTYGGSVAVSAYVGGIVGALTLNTYSGSIKNCVNYGTVTDSGKCASSGSKWAEIGGIVGGSQGKSSLLYSYIQNCANYGTIIHSGETSNLAIGGIAGFGYYSSIQNCVSSGVISTNRRSDCIGIIVGAISEYAEIIHCYWTSDVGDFNVYDPDKTITVSATSISLVSLNKTTVAELNEYAAEQGDTWNKWFVVHLNGGSINNITQESLAEIQGRFPEPVKEENTFLSWCKDAECNEVFDPKKDSVSGITDIYAKWDTSTTITNYVVTFDFDNGTTVNETFSYGSRIVYPAIIEREGYTSNGWDNMPDLMPAKNITITAQWTPNNYTVTFDFDNGTIMNETFSCNKPIEYPKNIIKEGYTFNGWDNYHEFMPAKNVTVTAQWTPNSYTVTFDFDNGTTANETFSYGSSIVYPVISEREGYTLTWNNYHEYMPANNITITAQWTPNNYTVKLDLGDGTILTSMKVTFNSPYGTLPTPAKDGYTFVGWVTDNNDTVTSETEVTIPNNHTLYARWREIPTQYVEIVFGTKDLTEEEVSDLVKKYVNGSDFTIIKVEGGGDGDGTRVIIKFNDAEKAENFVEVIKESSGTKNVGFISGEDIMSFTITYYPMALLSIFIWM